MTPYGHSRGVKIVGHSSVNLTKLIVEPYATHFSAALTDIGLATTSLTM